MSEELQNLRLLEAVLFASPKPLEESELAKRLPEGTPLGHLLELLREQYANRGVNLVHTEDRWTFRTAPDLAQRLRIEVAVPRKMSRAAVETLAIVAYHQPVTRAEIEEIRGVEISKGTLDALVEAGWVRPKGRRNTPGRPVAWATTDAFLDHFGLESLEALPGMEELKAAGLLDARPAIAAYGSRAPSEDGPPVDVDEEEVDIAKEFASMPEGEPGNETDGEEGGGDVAEPVSGVEQPANDDPVASEPELAEPVLAEEDTHRE